MTLPSFISSKKGIKLMTFTSNFGKFIAIIGGVLWINNVSNAEYIVSAGALLVAFYYLLGAFASPTEQLDYTLVHPELAELDPEVKKK
jgi:hypothetical protein